MSSEFLKTRKPKGKDRLTGGLSRNIEPVDYIRKSGNPNIF